MKVNNTSRSGRNKHFLYLSGLTMLMLMVAISAPFALAAEKETTAEAIKPDTELSGEGAAASNPLAALNNTDLKYTYIRLDDPDNSRRVNYWIKGGWTFASWGKLSYELTYQETNITGSSESDWESLRLKPILFIKSGQSGSWKYRLATGFEWILDFDNRDKGIGSGSDQIAPLIGVALVPRQGPGNNAGSTGAALFILQRT